MDRYWEVFTEREGAKLSRYRAGFQASNAEGPELDRQFFIVDQRF